MCLMRIIIIYNLSILAETHEGNMFKTVFLISLILLAITLPVNKSEEVGGCFYRGVFHSPGSTWCDPVRCGFCRCDDNDVSCHRTVSF